jgi:hypothetical protein
VDNSITKAPEKKGFSASIPVLDKREKGRVSLLKINNPAEAGYVVLRGGCTQGFNIH